jgi:hypothetical protein
VGADEAHLDGELWPDYRLIITASDAGDEVLSAVPCPPPEPLPLRGRVHELDEHSWVWSTELTVDGARDAQWTAIKAARAGAEVAPLTVDGRTYDADPESQRRISGAVQLALIAALSVQVVSETPGESPTQEERLAALDAAGWSIDWTLADNSIATLTAAQIIAVGVSLGAHVSAAHATARALRAQIAAAGADEITSITWPAP